MTDPEVINLHSQSTNVESDSVRERRNKLLKQSDWTQANDSPLANDKKTEWKTYRQSLRDLPKHSKFPNLEDSDYPTQPK